MLLRLGSACIYHRCTAHAYRIIMAETFKVGDRIVHRLFGKGTVTDILPISDDIVVTIDFDSGKTKKLCAYIAKLEKLQNEDTIKSNGH